ncbi:MAG: hypothetical protein IJU95_09410 [Treponema sp.]|nr:hypothetical protein [Treponema sp.]
MKRLIYLMGLFMSLAAMTFCLVSCSGKETSSANQMQSDRLPVQESDFPPEPENIPASAQEEDIPEEEPSESIPTVVISGAVSKEFPFGKQLDYPSEWGNLTVNEDSVVINGERSDGTLRYQNGYMTMQTEDILYAILHCSVRKSEFVTLIKETDSEKYAYSCWEMPYSITGTSELSTQPALSAFHVIKASSYVSEENEAGERIDFVPRELFGFSENPWAVRKDAPEKKIYIDSERYRYDAKYAPIDDLVLVNGFVRPGKERLFTLNARAKTILVKYDGICCECTLEDTGNYQVIPLPKSIAPKAKTPIEIEILDSYPGSKYDDIVISGIFYRDAVLRYQ